MKIKELKVKNFKSFNELEVELGDFNVLIGPNAAGKSNFIRIFEFLRDIAKLGLDNAISIQGDIEYIKNINSKSNENMSIDIKFTFGKFGKRIKDEIYLVEFNEISYGFELNFNVENSSYQIVRDELIQKIKFFKIHRNKTEEKEEYLGDGEIVISRKRNGEVEIKFKHPENIPIKKEDLYPDFFMKEKIPENSLLINTPYFVIPFPLIEIFGDISIYDFDPKLPKKAIPVTGKIELEQDGSNLSIILNNIIKNPDKKKKLFNLVRDLLPFVSNLDVEKLVDKSLLFKLEEKYFKDNYIPASLISDGTINTIALIITLYFEKRNLTIIEEPERNIHPYLISKIVEMMEDASKRKQIIVTTHNPEIVKHTNLENILFVSRDEKKGSSIISRPVDKEEIRIFLENEIGIEELFIKNLLRG
ncbi:ATPase [Marinitoga sp. 1135]|uniref:AAA family ATPase n=1 Tax=Marinitoga sp. 1135 TaxID=1643333 RepID=UPI0015864C5A|nr:AAA family ATPase [Marinitoga sp. 1135]NUU95802.1 ATPase [Marinitoga sp. 1135]